MMVCMECWFLVVVFGVRFCFVGFDVMFVMEFMCELL